MSPTPDLLLVSPISAALKAQLAERFTLHDDPAAALRTIRAIVGTGMSRVDADLIGRLPALEIVAIHGVGHDGVDLDAARARNIRVTITPDVLTDDVADLAIGLLLAVQRRIAANDRAVREGGWAVPLGRRASGRRIGIFGMGKIGQAIARRAAPFAAEIVYTSRTAKPDLAWRFVPDLRALARESDILIVAVAAGPSVDKAIGGDVLDLLGPDGVIVTIVRGSVVDETALVAALEQGRIAGAGLDVFAAEPFVPEGLQRLDQVVLAPHQGSATREGRAEMAALVIANLDAHFAGDALPSPLI
jgi:lactate dehydrogenase-like 2-hydroxyacid dehydrogenase